MKPQRTIIFLLAALVGTAAAPLVMGGGEDHRTASSSLVWAGFLYGMPVLLAVFVIARQRWALMACVMYGTIGLALDMATLVQELTGPATQLRTLAWSGLSGLLNFVLIILAGRIFMHGEPASTLPAFPPPNPRPPSTPYAGVPVRIRQI